MHAHIHTSYMHNHTCKLLPITDLADEDRREDGRGGRGDPPGDRGDRGFVSSTSGDADSSKRKAGVPGGAKTSFSKRPLPPEPGACILSSKI